MIVIILIYLATETIVPKEFKFLSMGDATEDSFLKFDYKKNSEISFTLKNLTKSNLFLLPQLKLVYNKVKCNWKSFEETVMQEEEHQEEMLQEHSNDLDQTEEFTDKGSDSVTEESISPPENIVEGSEKTIQRILEVYFNNFSMNYKNRDVHFTVKFEAFFEDGTNIMERTISFGSETAINQVTINSS
jgi:hypothetical protein